MTLTTFLLQALASLLAIITFLIVLNVQRSMLIPGGVLGMSIWLLYLILKEPTNVIFGDLYCRCNWFLYQPDYEYSLQNTSRCFCFSHLGSTSSRLPVLLEPTSFLVTGDYGHAISSAMLVMMLALVISIGMASGTVLLKLYHYLKKNRAS